MKKKIGVIATGLFLGVVIGCFGWKAYEYKDVFAPKTTINGMSCAHMSVEEVEERIRKNVEDYTLQLQLRDEKTEKISGKDIDLQYESSHEVKQLLEEQNPFLWFTGYFQEKEYTVKEESSFNKEKLEKEIHQLSCMEKEKQEEPKNAKIRFKKDRFIIVDEVLGNTIDEKIMVEKTQEAVKQREPLLDGEKAGIYVMPEITREDELLKRQMEQLNGLVKVQITYKLPNGKKVLNGNTLRKWLVKDQDGNYRKEEEKFEKKLNQFVSDLASEVDTVGKPRLFHTTSGHDVEVTGGRYGWKINQEKERKALAEDIARQKNVSRKPKYSSKEKYKDNHGIGDTYIEVNLTEQHLYYYQKGKIVLESPLVSGTMVRSRFTPPGVYFLTYKQKNRVLRGDIRPDGTYGYESPVSYWMPFNGGIGLHDAPWRGAFGGTYYRYSGSHGCINLPISKAREIYQLIDKETPIVCVYNDGYRLHG